MSMLQSSRRPRFAMAMRAAIVLGLTTVGLLSATAAHAITPIIVKITTGSDDLRGGNSAFISLNLTDGTTTSERLLGGGFGQNSVVTRRIVFTETIPLSSIRSITIRHDGAPRRDHPFDGYDNWDLQRLSVSLSNNRWQPIANIYNSINDRRSNRNSGRSTFVMRFTGRDRQLNLPNQAPST